MAWRNNQNIDELLKIIQNEDEVIVFDLETTGLSRTGSRVIQFSGIKYRINGGKFEELEVVDTYINPEIPIPAKITEITGISDETVADAPTEDEFFASIKKFFGPSPVLSGYNSRAFDIPLMKNMYQRHEDELIVKCDTDVLRLSKDFLVNEDLKDKKLGTVAHYYGVDTGLTFHNSLDDVRATARLLMLYNEKAKEMEEEKAKRVAFKMTPEITKVLFWAGFKGHSRVYVQTNCGDFYYDAFKKEWGTGKNNIYTVDEINMDILQKNVWKKYGVSSDEDMFSKVKATSTYATA